MRRGLQKEFTETTWRSLREPPSGCAGMSHDEPEWVRRRWQIDVMGGVLLDDGTDLKM